MTIVNVAHGRNARNPGLAGEAAAQLSYCFYDFHLGLINHGGTENTEKFKLDNAIQAICCDRQLFNRHLALFRSQFSLRLIFSVFSVSPWFNSSPQIKKLARAAHAVDALQQ